MRTAAKLGFPEMTTLLEKIPSYREYRSTAKAADREREYRRAMGLLLKECGDYLLSVAEKRSQILSGDMQRMIDGLIDRVGLILRRLDREGSVCLVGDCETTILELQELDVRLILLIEEAMDLVRNLATEVPASSWFQLEAARLSRGLATFSEMTEERNYLLGLGWESEISWS